MEIVTPNSEVSPSTRSYLVIGWGVLLLILWMIWKPQIFPTPIEVLQAFPSLIQDGLLDAVLASLVVNLEALCLSTCIGLGISYISRVPIVVPFASFLAKLRFVGPAVFFLPLLFLTSTGHSVKVLLIMLGQLFYLVTNMTQIVQNLPEYRFDDARTLKMGEWLSIWYVVIRGTVAEAIDCVRDNAAIGWSMLMFVEGVVRSEGGIGVMMYNMEKHIEFASVYAIVLTILLIGLTQDYVIGLVKKAMCPYV